MVAITDDAFELVRDLAELKQVAKDSGNTDLMALAIRISDRTSHLSRKLTELLEREDAAKIHADENVKSKYVMKNVPQKRLGGSGGPP